MQPLRKTLFFIFLAIATPTLAASPPERRPGLDRIGHIIVLFLENRSFDHLYGMFPGADGVDDAGFAAIQVSAAGLQFQRLPAVIINRSPWPGSSESSFGVDTRFATGLPNGRFRADRYVGLWEEPSTPYIAFTRSKSRSTTARWTSLLLCLVPVRCQWVTSMVDR